MATGGTGLFAVQLAKLAGMHVIGTCGSADKAAMLRTLGVDRVVNYKHEDLKQVRSCLRRPLWMPPASGSCRCVGHECGPLPQQIDAGLRSFLVVALRFA